jgi:hypothetical protein
MTLLRKLIRESNGDFRSAVYLNHFVYSLLHTVLPFSADLVLFHDGSSKCTSDGLPYSLTRIGINAPTRVAIAENGFITVQDLVSITDKDLDKLPKHLETWRVPNAAPNAQVRIPFLSLKKLKA